MLLSCCETRRDSAPNLVRFEFGFEGRGGEFGDHVTLSELADSDQLAEAEGGAVEGVVTAAGAGGFDGLGFAGERGLRVSIRAGHGGTAALRRPIRCRRVQGPEKPVRDHWEGSRGFSDELVGLAAGVA